MWVDHPTFLEVVEEAWKMEVRGIPMYKLVKRLKNLKKDLRALNKAAYSDIEAQYQNALERCTKAQKDMHADIQNVT